MEISNLDILVDTIKNTDKETAVKMIVEYGNKRCANSIERAWNKARTMQRASLKHKRDLLNKHILERMEYKDSISILSFERFFFGIIDVVRDANNTFKTKEDLADEIENQLHLRIGNVKVDRRSLFSQIDSQDTKD